MSVELTIFTPTYNRGFIIDILYKSLLVQTNCNFEWIIIDDGSLDDTEREVQSFLDNGSPFPIYYYKKENHGKHVAINDAVKIAQGRLFFIVDSDDYLIPDAVEKILFWENSIKYIEGFAGVSGLRGSDAEHLIGSTFIGNYIDCTSLERRMNNITGDKAEVFYTDVLKKYPFPVFENENFIEESLAWNKIAEDGYKIRWFNEIIYICNYRDDGLTKNIIQKENENPQGYAYSLKHNIIRHGHYSKRDIINIYYNYYCRMSKSIGLKKCAKYLDTLFIIMLYVVIRCKIRDGIKRR